MTQSVAKVSAVSDFDEQIVKSGITWRLHGPKPIRNSHAEEEREALWWLEDRKRWQIGTRHRCQTEPRMGTF